MQNSYTHRQAISDALEESYATIDFGPEVSSSDEDYHGKSRAETEIKTNSAFPISASPQLPADEEQLSSQQTDEINKNKNNPEEIQIFEKVTSVDESVIPFVEENEVNNVNIEIVPLPNSEESDINKNSSDFWSMRSIPAPPSGFQDSIDPPDLIPDPIQKDEFFDQAVIVPSGPMKFSIDSYVDRAHKEEPYKLKLTRTESVKDEAEKTFIKSQPKATATVLSRDEPYFTIYNSNATIAGKLVHDHGRSKVS